MATNNNKDYDHMFKVLVVGNSAVGKSALLQRFAEGNFDDSYVSTIGIDFKVRTINIDDQRIKLQIWDTAGQERFRTIGTAYYRNTHGVIVVYDVTSKESFLNIERWLHEINQNCYPRYRQPHFHQIIQLRMICKYAENEVYFRGRDFFAKRVDENFNSTWVFIQY